MPNPDEMFISKYESSKYFEESDASNEDNDFEEGSINENNSE